MNCRGGFDLFPCNLDINQNLPTGNEPRLRKRLHKSKNRGWQSKLCAWHLKRTFLLGTRGLAASNSELCYNVCCLLQEAEQVQMLAQLDECASKVQMVGCVKSDEWGLVMLDEANAE
jgi:hypothetical protein